MNDGDLFDRAPVCCPDVEQLSEDLHRLPMPKSSVPINLLISRNQPNVTGVIRASSLNRDQVVLGHFMTTCHRQ
jgi:hypothetical protein